MLRGVIPRWLTHAITCISSPEILYGGMNSVTAVVTVVASPSWYIAGQYIAGQYIPGRYIAGQYIPGQYIPGRYILGGHIFSVYSFWHISGKGVLAGACSSIG